MPTAQERSILGTLITRALQERGIEDPFVAIRPDARNHSLQIRVTWSPDNGCDVGVSEDFFRLIIRGPEHIADRVLARTLREPPTIDPTYLLKIRNDLAHPPKLPKTALERLLGEDLV